MVGIHDAGRILQIPLGIQPEQQLQILIVVIRDALVMLVDGAPQDTVGQRVSRRLHFPGTENEIMAMLRRIDRIQHDVQRAAGRVFHADRHIDAAGGQTVLLILHRTGADGNVGQHIGQIAEVLRVQHFISRCKACLLNHLHMKAPDCHKPLVHVGLLLRIRLVQHALVAAARRPRLIGVDARN